MGVASWVVFMPDRSKGPADVCGSDHRPHSPILQPRLASPLTASMSFIPSSPGRQAEWEVLFFLQLGQQRLLLFNDLATPC